MTYNRNKAKLMPAAVFTAVLGFILLSAAEVGAVDYNWGSLLKNNDAWFAGAEARAIGDSIVKYQLTDGGWRKAMDDVSQTGEWGKSTVDNDATTSQINFLARLYRQNNTAKYLTSCQNGIDLLLAKQYSNGGWPQVFGAAAGSYHTHITYNDGAMVKILDLLKAVSEKSGSFTFIDNDRAAKAKNAVDKGVDCILKTQITFTSGEYSGEKTAWCQQHNSSTLAPAGARAYELPSVSGSESVGIVDFLKKYHTSLGNNQRLDVVRAINSAVEWMDKVKITGKKVENITTNGEADRRVVDDPSSTIWARFYELQTNRPIFAGRDGIIKYSLAEIEQERRAGYAYYGNWPGSLIKSAPIPEPPDVDIGPQVPVGIYIGSGTFVDSVTVFDLLNAPAWSIKQNFSSGAKAFGDREFTTGPVPSNLQGAEWISTSMASRTLAAEAVVRFKMKKSGIVHLLYEDRVTAKPAWVAESGFTATKQTITVYESESLPRYFTVYIKKTAAGDTITMGANSGDGMTSCMMYFMAFTEDQTSSVFSRVQAANHSLKISNAGKGGVINVNYSIADRSPVRLDLFDIRGNRVRTLINTTKNAGAYSENIRINGLAAGAYVVKLNAGPQILRERVLIAK
ncbi:MAG: pectate lyase [Chitinispirillia bacterium]|nr:pectate lyase [Chitinispirillia bacterium]MCL2241856.1 pectate lyase [Chitinispirillia bacterium]